MKTTSATAASRSVPATRRGISRRRFLERGTLATLSFAASTRGLFAEGTSPALVTTPMGKLQGEATPEGVRIFRGVPFAQPPVGPLRFRAPAPIKPWPETRDATRFRPAAMQAGEHGDARSEDCLYLNVFAPAGEGPYPVFVWIHGGSFTGGRPTAPIFDGSGFARDGIVCVTVAYRLGVFGFMDMEALLGQEYAGSGNNGLRDLLASLAWVHANIASFGGDPERVTIGGESAGAKATAALMAIPEAKALFVSAISESGGGERVLTRAEAAESARGFAQQWRRDHPTSGGANPAATLSAGAPPNVRPGAWEDLVSAPADALIDTQTRFIDGWPRDFPFRPVVDGHLLLKRPVDMVADGSAKGKRLLIGTNRDESALFLGAHPPTGPTQRLLGNLTVERFNAVFSRYARIYPQMSLGDRRIRAVTAEEYWVPSIRLADAHVRAGGTAWMYRLDYTKPTGPMAGEAYHSLDLGLVWQRLDKDETGDANAELISGEMHRAWTTFIHGDPPAGTRLPEWPEYTAAARPTMVINAISHVEQRPGEAELQLWNGVL